MPPQFLFDLSAIDLHRVILDQEAIREYNPQRGDMEHLNGIIHVDESKGEILGYKDVRADEFWVAGHIPGRPLLPGVIMIEAAAQLASFYARKYTGLQGFVGFGGVDGVKFRAAVTPGQRLLILGRKLWHRHKRICCDLQGVVDGNMVFEAQITGTEM